MERTVVPFSLVRFESEMIAKCHFAFSVHLAFFELTNIYSTVFAKIK